MISVKISKSVNGRYRLHYGASSIEGNWEVTGPLIQEQIELAFASIKEDCINFEFAGEFLHTDFANVVHEINCVTRARENLYRAYEAKVPRPELREAFDCFVTAATTINWHRVRKVLGIETDDEESRKAG